MTSEAFPNRRRQVGGPKETKSCNVDYCDESDEEKDRRPNDERMFDNACALGQFFLNPCLCLYLCGQQVRRKHGVRGFMPSRTTKRVGLAVLVALLLVGSFKECSTFRIHPLRPRNDWEVNRLPVQIPYFDFSSVDDVGGWTYPRRDQRFPSLARMRRRLEREKIGDFGGLVFVSLRDPLRFRREIDPHDGDKYEKERKFQVENMDKSVLSPLYWHDDELDQVVCHRPNWRNSYFPNCNDFHEIDLSRDFVEGIESENDQPYDSYRFNHGFYREAWLVNDVQRSEGTVLKTLRGKHDFTPRTMRMVQRDAIIMERLTSSSRIIDMYGHCGTSITVEPISYELELYAVPKGYMKKEELADKYDVNPQNDFTATEKLEMALEMAESLAVLHGYEGGVIVHDDVQLCQWLRTKAGKLVLGDFNRAEIMDWDKDKEAYCKYNNGFAYGNWRSPEEFSGKDLNEKIDVFSLGNNMYGLLTGLWVYYENEDDGVVQKAVISGNHAYIDERYRSRSFAEQKLVEAIEMCWEYEPDKRVDIFTLIEFLQQAVDGVRLREQISKGGGAHYPNQGGYSAHHDQEVGLELSKD